MHPIQEILMAAKKTTPKPMTKSEILAFIADDTGFSKKEVTQVLDALNKCIKKSLGRSAPVSLPCQDS